MPFEYTSRSPWLPNCRGMNRSRAQQQKDADALEARRMRLVRMLRQEVEDGAERAVDDHREEAHHEEVRRRGEELPGFADAAEVREADEDDGHDAEPHAITEERRE